MKPEKISENHSFGGQHIRYKHRARALGCDMNFSVYLPPQADASKRVPVFYWLSGLTCTDENFMQKAGAHRIAAELGFAIIAPDTSPRGENIADAPGEYDLGIGAGFYVNAVREPWAQHYQMYDYVTKELPALIEENFPVTEHRCIGGHSMGGHGALMIALRNPTRYASVSAFSPICNPADSPWGRKAFTAYLGEDQSSWAEYDSCLLMRDAKKMIPMRIDQGLSDQFLTQELMPERLETAAKVIGYPLEMHLHAKYDHSYFFIASFIEAHLRFHARYIGSR